MKKNSCKPINPKKYSCYGLKKIRARNLITKKNSCGSKISLPPHNFSNGPSLTQLSLLHKTRVAMRFPAKIISSCICFASCHTCSLSSFTLVCPWCGRTGVRPRDYQNFSDGQITIFSQVLGYAHARSARALSSAISQEMRSDSRQLCIV